MSQSYSNPKVGRFFETRCRWPTLSSEYHTAATDSLYEYKCINSSRQLLV